MMRAFLRARKPEIERHPAGEPCGDYTRRISLNFERKTPVHKTAVCPNRGLDVAISTRPLQISADEHKAGGNEENRGNPRNPIARAVTSRLPLPRPNSHSILSLVDNCRTGAGIGQLYSA